MTTRDRLRDRLVGVLGEPDAELVAARLVEPVRKVVSAATLFEAADAFRRFGKGRHAAALNLGDCIASATARHEVLPLLFKGDDFAQTDLERA